MDNNYITMRTYYINNGKENGGPFTFDELKNQHISRGTLVWHQGMDEWKYAPEIEELKPYFTVIPPPIKRQEPALEIEIEEKSETILGLQKTYFYLTALIVFVFIAVLILNFIQSSKRTELDQKNKQTEFSNEQILLQQKEFNEQRIQQEIQEKIELDNRSKRRKDSIQHRLTEIKTLLVEDKNDLYNAKRKLADAEGFKLFRTESEKMDQISAIQNDIENRKKEMEQLENESNRLHLELATIR